jgi:hypothetical protein
MAEGSQIPDALLDAYRKTQYRVMKGEPFTLLVGTRSKELAELLARTGCASAAFITAWNPFSEPAALEANVAALAALKADLEGAGCMMLAGLGEDPEKTVSGEPSFLAVGLSLEAAKALGAKYRQNAIVWADADAVPQLVLLR